MPPMPHAFDLQATHIHKPSPGPKYTSHKSYQYVSTLTYA
jgi:hypothetical protein